ncbi:hypothetical protein K0M31_007699 [Melipona bicolor]|uniref:Uncharacterized protein n=1 Tax=Melipona bicolor TaxID=60889 RepID=A0AA40GBW2_9HYME|nr:hypothetical protein K0M31_007699 [Melipona bicolor]
MCRDVNTKKKICKFAISLEIAEKFHSLDPPSHDFHRRSDFLRFKPNRENQRKEYSPDEYKNEGRQFEPVFPPLFATPNLQSARNSHPRSLILSSTSCNLKPEFKAVKG